MDYQPIDDEFAKDFSEYKTLNEWKDEILANLRARRKTSVEEKFAREVMAKIIADSDLPIDDDLKEEMTQIYYDDFHPFKLPVQRVEKTCCKGVQNGRGAGNYRGGAAYNG